MKKMRMLQAENSKCKGPEAGICLRRGARGHWLEQSKTGGGWEVRELKRE